MERAQVSEQNRDDDQVDNADDERVEFLAAQHRDGIETDAAVHDNRGGCGHDGAAQLPAKRAADQEKDEVNVERAGGSLGEEDERRERTEIDEMQEDVQPRAKRTGIHTSASTTRL